MKKLFIIVGVLVVIGAVIGGGLYLAFPVQMSTVGGLSRNYVLSLGHRGHDDDGIEPGVQGAGASRSSPPPTRPPRMPLPATGRATTEPSTRTVSRRLTRSPRRMPGS